jgi:hypothetical protein
MENNEKNTNHTIKGKYSFVGSVSDFRNYVLNHGELEEIKEPKCTEKSQ